MNPTLRLQTSEEWPAGRTGVLLVEDASSTRRLLQAVLESTNTFEVVGEADTGAEALEITEILRPDVILLDLSLPDMDGARLLPKLLQIAPATKVVVLSNKARLVGPGLIESGATAFIEKGLPPSELLASLVAALRESPVDSPEDPPVDLVVAVAVRRPSRAVIADDDPVIREQISLVLARCGLKMVTQVVATTDVAGTVSSAIEMAGPSLVVIGEVAGTAPLELIGDLAGRYPQSTFIAYGTGTASLEPRSASGRFAFVVRPDLEGLERRASQFIGGPAR